MSLQACSGLMSFVNRFWIVLTGGFLFVITLLLSLQGFDLTDEGYVLVAYQNIFVDSQYAGYMFGTYLTAIVGGVWEKLFGWGGWYSFRVFNAIVIVGGYVLTCYTLKAYWKYKWFLFVAFMVVVLNMNIEHGTLVFHYYTFSAFMNCLIGLLLFYSFQNGNYKLLFMSSIVLGINVFVRIPNVTLCAIPFALSVSQFFYNRDNKKMFRQFSIISCGMLIGISMMLLLMYMGGHIGLFVDAITGLSDTAQNAKSNHGIIPMLHTTYVNLKFVIYETFTMLAAMVVCFAASDVFTWKSYLWNRLFLVITGFVFYFIFKHIHSICYPYFERTTLLVAFSYALCLISLWKNYQKREVVYLLVIVFLISNLQPFGSDCGIGNMGPYAIWGGVPAAVVLALDKFSNSSKLTKQSMTAIISVFLFYTIITYGHTVYKTCYRDSGTRQEKTYKIQSSSLATVFTSQERGEEIDALLNECKKYFVEGDTVFMALDMPGMHYLIKTKPFLQHPWPMLNSEETFEKKLKEAAQKCPHPIIVERTPFYYDETNSRFVMNVRNLHEFIKENHYKMVWENQQFKIYK